MVLGGRGLDAGEVELSLRRDGEKRATPIGEMVPAVKALLEELRGRQALLASTGRGPHVALFGIVALQLSHAFRANNATCGTGVAEAAKRSSWGSTKPQIAPHWELQGAIFCIVRFRRFAVRQLFSGEQCSRWLLCR